MTESPKESALERARRELLIGVASLVAGVDLKHWPPAAASEHHAKLNDAIARLEAAARAEGWKKAINLAMDSEDVKKAIAAARLAVAEQMYDVIAGRSDGLNAGRELRDRLRAGAGKEGKRGE